MIKAVTFDLDGVYFVGESFKRFKSALAPTADPDHVNQVLYKSNEMFKFKTGQISETDYWNFVIKELNLSLTHQQIFQLLRDSYETNPEVVDYVKQVRAVGYKTCICSNNFLTRIRELDMKFNFQADFDVKVISYQVGIVKPDPGIFKILVDRSGVQANEIAYSDDDASKLQGAIDLGINCFVFENFTQFKTELEKLGVNV